MGAVDERIERVAAVAGGGSGAVASERPHHAIRAQTMDDVTG